MFTFRTSIIPIADFVPVGVHHETHSMRDILLSILQRKEYIEVNKKLPFRFCECILSTLFDETIRCAYLISDTALTHSVMPNQVIVCFEQQSNNILAFSADSSTFSRFLRSLLVNTTKYEHLTLDVVQKYSNYFNVKTKLVVL